MANHTFVNSGCQGCRKCEGGGRNVGCACITALLACCTGGLLCIAFPFIGRCPTCGHTRWLNRHSANGQTGPNAGVTVNVNATPAQ